MAFDAAGNSPPRSHFQKSVSLQDWWLTKPQADDDRKTIGVSGLTCTSQLNRAERCFSSAPIVKVYDLFDLETVDGVCVILQGYINKEKTLGSGFSSEVFDHFLIGFPSYWEEFSTSCPKRGSSDECVSRGVEDCKDKVLSNKASSVSLDTPHFEQEEPVLKAGDEVLYERPLSTSKFDDMDVVGNITALEFLGGKTVSSRPRTRSMTNMGSSKNHGATFVDPEIARRDKDDYQYQRNKSTFQVGSFDLRESNDDDHDAFLDQLRTSTTSMKGSGNKKRDKEGGRVDVPGEEGATARQGIASVTRSKRKLTFERKRCEIAKRQKHITSPKSTSTPTGTLINKEGMGSRSMERYVSGNVLSPEFFSGKRSRSGRVLLPSLEFWRNQTVVYDAGLDRQVTGVRDVAQSSKIDTSENSKALKKKDRKE